MGQNYLGGLSHFNLIFSICTCITGYWLVLCDFLCRSSAGQRPRVEYVPPPVVYHLPADITTSTQRPHPTSRTSGSMTRNAAYNYSSSSSLRDDARDETIYTMNEAYRRVSPVNISPGQSQTHHHPPCNPCIYYDRVTP